MKHKMLLGTIIVAVIMLSACGFNITQSSDSGTKKIKTDELFAMDYKVAKADVDKPFIFTVERYDNGVLTSTEEIKLANEERSGTLRVLSEKDAFANFWFTSGKGKQERQEHIKLKDVDKLSGQMVSGQISKSAFLRDFNKEQRFGYVAFDENPDVQNTKITFSNFLKNQQDKDFIKQYKTIFFFNVRLADK
ncbi:MULTISPECIES: hypothetical protein [Brochothrix]|uniref:Lipoprotein n=1 Tax=Brochothrix thermosphacta TaxID=2756 RepID=A0A1D2LD85_BROTH|nr:MULTISPECIES: hypothetical protein [Brochothrix]ATF26971.1 hypothetical protein CNY62_11720 [Brochothrix thermosphacta]ATH86328.1 hypothetical protein CPF12_11400 [Brochothrix thermosphacta]MBR5526908.1 hypothetical protein [Brochothrix sp.]MDO7862891.1 hypothetical protein [Brochothrix thermosphacta]MPQ27912.1 hypothetical protein [Brochothrix thermosphacta]